MDAWLSSVFYLLTWIAPFVLLGAAIFFFAKGQTVIAGAMSFALIVLVVVFLTINYVDIADTVPEQCQLDSDLLACDDHYYANDTIELLVHSERPLVFEDATVRTRSPESQPACTFTQVYAGAYGDELNVPVAMAPERRYHLEFTGCTSFPEEFIVDLTLVFEDRTIHGELASWTPHSRFAIRHGFT